MAIDDNASYELTGAQVKDLANKIKAKAADNIFTGATNATPGIKGIVPAPQAGDETKYLCGDGTWATVSGGGNTRTEFLWDILPNSMKDSTGTNAVTGQDVYDACEAGQVIIHSFNPKPTHYDEVVSYYYYQNVYRFVATYKSYLDSDHVMREYVYDNGAWQLNEVDVQSKLNNATSVTDGTMSAADKANLDSLINDDYLHDKFIAKGGTEIVSDDDLNTTDFLDLGMYFCPRNVTVATLVNCPTTNAFTMRVYSPNDDYVRDTMTGTWVYRVREIRDIAMNIYQQRAYAGNTPGSYSYSAWRRILTTDDGTISDKVDIASTDITDHAGTIADLVNGIYPEGYHRWYTQTNSGAANITDRPTTTNYGFVLEAFLVRNYTTSDYEYRVVCRTMSVDNQTYEGYVQKSTTSVNNWKKVVAGLVTNADINYNSTAVGIPTIYKMPGSGSGSAQYWKKICTLKLDTWREGTSTTVRIYAGQGYNSNPDQNFYIDLIGQTGNNTNKHFGWVAEMHQLTTGKNLSDFGVKVIAKSDTEYDVWYQTSVAYSYPHAVFYQTVQHNVTDPIVTCTFSSDVWQSTAPTGTECNIKKIMITGDYYRAGETIKLQSHYYACRYRILSNVLHAIFSIDTPRSTRHLSSFSFAATSSQYNEAYGPSGLVKSTTSATGWSFSMSRNDDDPYKIQVDATISSPASTPPHNSCGTVGITGTITLA